MEYEKQELLNKEIIIRGLYISGGVSEKTKKVWAKIKVTDQHDDKYSVWKTKQDGEITKAFAKMMEHSWFFNVAVGITYSEADKEFTDRNGKLVKYKERNIIGFSALNSHRPETEEHEEIERQIEKVLNEEIEEINTEEIPF